MVIQVTGVPKLMKKSSKFLSFLITTIITIMTSNLPAEVIPIDLNTFFADPTVTVSPDGFSALLSEDLNISPVLLANDPGLGDSGLGDPSIIFSGPIANLSFDYDFSTGSVMEDGFLAFVLTENGDGGSPGPDFEFFTDEDSFGRVEFDLLPLAGENLGLQFQLNSFDIVDGSSVQISNVNIVTPEPGTLSLFIILGIAFVFIIKIRSRKQSHSVISTNSDNQKG